MFSTSSNLGVKLGALVAATSLMLAGGVAVASASYAKDNPNGSSQGKKPDKGNGSSTAPGQNSANGPDGSTENVPNGGPDHGDNGQDKPAGNNSQNSNNGQGGRGTLSVNICHATRSAQNPYVFITVDASSVDELLTQVYGKGNGHGDHVGGIWDGQRSGVNWGDIIDDIYLDGKLYKAGYNRTAYSEALGADGAYLLANGCKGPKPPTVTVYWTYCANNAQVPAESGTGATEADAIANLNSKLPASNQYGSQGGSDDPDETLTCSVQPAQLCVIATGGTKDYPGGVQSEEYIADAANTAAYSTTSPCKDGFTTVSRTGSATMEAPLCHVDGEVYVKTSESATANDGTGTSDPFKIGDAAAEAAAIAQAQGRANDNAAGKAGAEVAAKLQSHLNDHRNDIVPPFLGVSKNWPDGAAIFEDDCQLPDGETVQSINLAAPATVAEGPASGGPQPARVPAAGAPLPAAIPAGEGSTAPQLPVWALAMMVLGALGAAGSAASLGFGRKE